MGQTFLYHSYICTQSWKNYSDMEKECKKSTISNKFQEVKLGQRKAGDMNFAFGKSSNISHL